MNYEDFSPLFSGKGGKCNVRFINVRLSHF